MTIRVDGERAYRLAVAVAVLIPPASLVCLFPLVVNLPTWDQWSMIEVWSAHAAGDSVLGLLLAPYNGHLNFVPRFVFYLLGLASHWNVRLEVFASYLVATATLSISLRMLRPVGESRWLLAVPVACQSFSFLQYENFLSGYPLGQNLAHFFSTLALFLLTGTSVGGKRWLGAVAASSGATFSWGAGLASWYAGLAALVLRRDISRTKLAGWALLAATATAVVRRGAGSSFGAIDWPTVPRFFFALLGRAWHPIPAAGLGNGIILGVFAVTAFLVTTALAARARRDAALPWIAWGTNALIGAGLIALGRAGTGLHQAMASHYTTTAYPLLVAVLVLGALALSNFPLSLQARSGLIGCAGLAIAAQAVTASVLYLPLLRASYPIVRANALAIVRGSATDEAIRRSHHPQPGLVRSGTEILRRERLAWFQDLIDGDAPAGAVLRIAGHPFGAVSIDGDAQWTIEGWAVRSAQRGGPVRGVALEVDGETLALAKLDLTRPEVEDPRFRDSGFSIAVPAGALRAGRHRVRIVARDFGYGAIPLADTEIESLVRASAAR